MDWKELTTLPPEELAAVKYDDPRLDSFANAVEERYGLPRDFLVAVKNAGERSNTGQVSTAGAKGVMQFIDSTRKAYPHDPADPLDSLDAAGRYFKDLGKQYKENWMAAIAHYNGGGRAGRAVLKNGEPPAVETRNYLSRIRSFMEQRSKAVADAIASAR